MAFVSESWWVSVAVIFLAAWKVAELMKAMACVVAHRRRPRPIPPPPKSQSPPPVVPAKKPPPTLPLPIRQQIMKESAHHEANMPIQAKNMFAKHGTIAAGVAMGTLFAADPPLRVDASSSSDAGSSRTDVRAIRSAARELEPPSFSAALPSTGIHGIPATAQMSAWRPM